MTVVREIHVFGSEVPLGAQSAVLPKHKVLEAKLLKEAERISQVEFKAQKNSNY